MFSDDFGGGAVLQVQKEDEDGHLGVRPQVGQSDLARSQAVSGPESPREPVLS